jgi:hypothetical protein
MLLDANIMPRCTACSAELHAAACLLLQVGSFLGLMSDRGRGSIASYVGNVVYNIVALGLMAMVRAGVTLAVSLYII